MIAVVSLTEYLRRKRQAARMILTLVVKRLVFLIPQWASICRNHTHLIQLGQIKKNGLSQSYSAVKNLMRNAVFSPLFILLYIFYCAIPL